MNIPQYIFIGRIQSNALKFACYNEDRIKEKIENLLINEYDYKKEQLYWVNNVLFDNELDTFDNWWEGVAIYFKYHIDDAQEYIEELTRKEL